MPAPEKGAKRNVSPKSTFTPTYARKAYGHIIPRLYLPSDFLSCIPLAYSQPRFFCSFLHLFEKAEPFERPESCLHGQARCENDRRCPGQTPCLLPAPRPVPGSSAVTEEKRRAKEKGKKDNFRLAVGRYQRQNVKTQSMVGSCDMMNGRMGK